MLLRHTHKLLLSAAIFSAAAIADTTPADAEIIPPSIAPQSYLAAQTDPDDNILRVECLGDCTVKIATSAEDQMTYDFTLLWVLEKPDRTYYAFVSDNGKQTEMMTPPSGYVTYRGQYKVTSTQAKLLF